MKSVLIVDDSKSIRNEVAELLTRSGYTVSQAANGNDALDFLTKHPEVGLLILDVNMPGMNGLDLLERIRADHRQRALPVVMLTTEAERSLVARAQKAGAKGWLLKPIKPDVLLKVVTQLAS